MDNTNQDTLRVALDTLIIETPYGTRRGSPFLVDKDPVETIDRVKDVLEAVSLTIANGPDMLTALADARGGQAVTVILDTLVHALEVAKALIMSPEDEGGAA